MLLFVCAAEKTKRGVISTAEPPSTVTNEIRVGMITVKDLNDIAGNKIKNEAQKAIIRSSFLHILQTRCVLLLMGKSGLSTSCGY